MIELITEKSPRPPKKDPNKVRASWIFGSLFFVFLVYVIIYVPASLPEFKQRILAILSGLLSGLFAFFLTGEIVVENRSIKTNLGRQSIKATGGIAIFVLVLWWWFSPLAPVTISEGIYRVRVTVLNPQQIVVQDPEIWSSIGNEPMKVAGGWQIEVRAENKPLDGKVTIFASKKSDHLVGKYELLLADDPNPAITVQLQKDKSAFIRGIVTDEDGKAVSGAKISIVGYEKETITTASDGNFVLRGHTADGEKVLLHIEVEKYQPMNEWHPAGEKPVTIVLKKTK